MEKFGDRIVQTDPLPKNVEFVSQSDFLKTFEKYGLDPEEVRLFLELENIHKNNLEICLRVVNNKLYRSK